MLSRGPHRRGVSAWRDVAAWNVLPVGQAVQLVVTLEGGKVIDTMMEPAEGHALALALYEATVEATTAAGPSERSRAG